MSREVGYIISAEDFEQLQRIAKAILASRMFDSLLSKDKDIALAEILVRIVAGHELGLGTMASMMGLNVIQGSKVSLSSHLQLGLAKQAGYSYTISYGANHEVKLEWFDPSGKQLGFTKFDKADADRAGLNSATWQKYPTDMCFARAGSAGVRRFCADATAGIVTYIPEELGEADDLDDEPKFDPVKLAAVKARKLKQRIADLESAGQAVPEDMRAKLAGYEGPPPVKESKRKAKPAPLEVVPADAIKPELDEHGEPLPMTEHWLKRYVKDDEQLLKISALGAACKHKDFSFSTWLGDAFVCTAESLAELLADAEEKAK